MAILFNKIKNLLFVYPKINTKKNKWNFDTRKMAFGAIFSSVSVIITIVLLSYTPIITLPTIRIAFEGILIKICGYLFGVVVGFFSGNLAEILINLYRPTFFHWSYYLAIVLYGVIGGIISYFNNDKRIAHKGFFYFITVMILSACLSAITIHILNASNGSFNYHSIHLTKRQFEEIFFICQAFIILFLPAMRFFCTQLFCQYNYIYQKMLPIYFFAILTGYFVTIPLVTIGDSSSYHLSYSLLVLFAIIQTPINVVVNVFLIYIIWSVIHKIIYRSMQGKYNNIFANNLNAQIDSSNKKITFNDVYKGLAKSNSNLSEQEKYWKWKKSNSLYHIENFSHIILITGTNGKGTVAHAINRYLIKKGKNTGLFISPHIFETNERIQLNNSYISNEKLYDLFERIKIYIKKYNFNYFSSLFLIALLWFEETQIDYLIIEAGIGAKHDITNVLNNEIGVVTSIGKDHSNILGPTLEDICKDKMHVLKKDQKLFIDETNFAFCKIYNDFAKKQNGKIFNIAKYKKIKENFAYLYNNENIDYKSRNLLLASNILANVFKTKDYLKIYNYISKYLIYFIEYKEKINDKKYLLDSAHNYPAVSSKLKFLFSKQKFDYVIYSAIKTKEYLKIIKFLQNFLPKTTKLFLVQNSHKETIKKNDVKSFNIDFQNNYEFLWNLPNKHFLIIGSNYLIGDVYNFLLKKKQEQK